MPLQEAAPRPAAPRYQLKVKPRQTTLDVIEQLFGMLVVVGALQSSLDALFVLEPSADMLVLMDSEQAVLWAFACSVVHVLQTSVRHYFQRRQLGADGSGGMLAGAQLGRRGPPPTAADWGDAQCVRRTRFSVSQIACLLCGFDMMRPDGTPKTYRIFTSDKLYRKRQRNGALSKPCGKYFVISAETAILVLLINLTLPIAFCDMQMSLNGMPSPEISLTINFMLDYLQPWWHGTSDLEVWLPRFEMYGNSIVMKGSRIGAGGVECRVVGFTDGTLMPTCRPHGAGNH